MLDSNQTLRKVRLLPNDKPELKVDKKIYLRISVSEHQLTIDKISKTVKRLLGFPYHEVNGANISVLIPSFYRHNHEKIVK